MIGIYCIENIINNKKYIGQSVDINTRLRKHFSKLKSNKHENKYLQNSFNKYGRKSFKSYILEICEENELNEKEKYWISKSNSYEKGYNLTIGGDGVNGWKADEDFKNRIREIVKGKNNPNYGHFWTKEMKENLAKKRKGQYEDENNPNSKKIICVETLKIYPTIKSASEELNLKNQVSITRCLKDKTNVANSFHFVEYNNDIYEYLLNNKFEYLCECYKNKNIFVDIKNKIFYYKKDLFSKIYESHGYTTREVSKILKQNEFEFNNLKYVLL